MSVRVTTGGETRSFRAQLVVENHDSMQLIAYTPVGTTAATIRATGDRVSVTDARSGSTTEGNASDMLRRYGFYTGGLTPAEMGMLLLGYPPRRDLRYEVTPNGLSRAEADDVVVTFDPPSLPAHGVKVVHGTDRVEIEHLEIATLSALAPRSGERVSEGRVRGHPSLGDPPPHPASGHLLPRAAGEKDM